MPADHYAFRSRRRIDADPHRVYAALADVASYPTWWPQVHEARELDDASGELRCRILLPYDLVFVARRDIEDDGERILRATVSGDLIGWSQWHVTAEGAGSLAVFDEDVVVRKALIRLAGPWPVQHCGSIMTGLCVRANAAFAGICRTPTMCDEAIRAWRTGRG